MKCKYCKNELKEDEKYCKKCGKSRTKPKNKINIETVKENRGIKIATNIFAVIGLITTFLTIIVVLVLIFWEFQTTKEEINLNGYEIPTVYKVVQEKPAEIEDYYDGEITYTYLIGSLPRGYIVAYLKELKNAGYKPANNTDGYINYFKKVDETNGIYITISRDQKNVFIKYTYKEVIEEKETLEGNKKVGNKDYGYIEIPNNYFQNLEEENGISFYNEDYTTYINIYKYSKDEFSLEEVIELEETYLDETYGIYTEVVKENGTLRIESLENDYGVNTITHIIEEENFIKTILISAEDKEDEIFNIINTYSKN